MRDATVWTSHGNYGSKVYDSLDGDTFLEALVCDDCLVQKRSLIEEVTLRRPQAGKQRGQAPLTAVKGACPLCFLPAIGNATP